MNDVEKRRQVMKMYSGPSWAKKVARMSDAQVFAIWRKEELKKAEAAKLKKQDKPQEDIPF